MSERPTSGMRFLMVLAAVVVFLAIGLPLAGQEVPSPATAGWTDPAAPQPKSPQPSRPAALATNRDKPGEEKEKAGSAAASADRAGLAGSKTRNLAGRGTFSRS